MRASIRGSTRAWAATLLVLTTAAVYFRVLGNGFVNYDDGIYVTENPSVRGGLSAQGAWWALSTSHAANWHPLTWLSHMLDCTLFGIAPAGHHLSSLLLHLANVLLLFLLLDRMTGRTGRSAWVAALFALHPLHVESVAWVAERKDVLSTFFLLLTIGAYAGYARKPGALRYLTALGLFALGLLAKPMLVTVPFVLLLLDFWPLGRIAGGPAQAKWNRAAGLQSTGHTVASEPRPPESRSSAPGEHRQGSIPLVRLAIEKLPFAGLAAASCAITVLAQRRGGALATADEIPAAMRVANAAVAYATYLVKSVWPVRLCAFYPLPAVVPAAEAMAATLFLAATTALALRFWRRYPWAATGWLWYLGTLVPVIGFVQVGLQSMADRYTYVPLIGIFVIVVWGAPEIVGHLPHGERALWVLAWLTLAGCSALTWKQLGTWRNSGTLFEHVLAVAPNNFVTRYHLGNILAGQGMLDEAIEQFDASLRLKPDAGAVHNNLGLALAGKGRLEEAAVHYDAALRIKPGFAEAHNNLGSLLAREGHRDEAIAQFAEAIRIRPDYPEAHNNLGVALGNQGKLDEAAAQFREALRLKPWFADGHGNLGFVLSRQGKFSDAILELEEAVRLGPQQVPSQLLLAATYAQAGQFAKAADAAEQARSLARTAGQQQLADDISRRIELYRSGRIER